MSTEDRVEPDRKDWTWVLERPCPECGYDASAVVGAEVPALVRADAAAWAEVLADGPAARRRPRPGVWSASEYACHVRDVHRLFDVRLARMLAEDDPLFDDWDQDGTAVRERYSEQDPGVVLEQLADAAERIARAFEAVDGEQWSRAGRRSDGARFTVDSFARYYLHDVVHHRHDVSR